MNGVLSGSATVFFAYIGFDSVASTAEEVHIYYMIIEYCDALTMIVIFCHFSEMHF